jgi:hypothetical protein
MAIKDDKVTATMPQLGSLIHPRCVCRNIAGSTSAHSCRLALPLLMVCTTLLSLRNVLGTVLSDRCIRQRCIRRLSLGGISPYKLLNRSTSHDSVDETNLPRNHSLLNSLAVSSWLGDEYRNYGIANITLFLDPFASSGFLASPTLCRRC